MTEPGPRFEQMKVLSPGGFVRVAWVEWGARDANKVAICCHGLTRNGRDFDPLALALAAAGWRVVAPDVPGRGRSEWLKRPEDYTYPFYVAAMAALIGRVGAETVDWVGTSMGGLIGIGRPGIESVDWIGTSMGGLIGMMLAAQPGTPIRRLVLNDIGAVVPKASIERIADYVGHDPRFETLDAAEAYLRHIHAPFGKLSDAEWRHLATHSTAAADKGHLRLHYDPAIAKAFASAKIEDVVLWPAVRLS
jgi:pimeloyl-ACP methyl ester carboxylesterase